MKAKGLMMALALLLAGCGPQVAPEVGRGPCDASAEAVHAGFPVRCGPQEESPH